MRDLIYRVNVYPVERIDIAHAIKIFYRVKLHLTEGTGCKNHTPVKARILHQPVRKRASNHWHFAWVFQPLHQCSNYQLGFNL